MARALTTPSTIIVAGAAAAAALAAGLPGAVVGGLAALAYAIKAALTVARPKELAKVIFPDIGIDLSRLDPTGLVQMQEALLARQSYRNSLHDCPAGPFKERFSDMGDKVDDAVEGLYKLVLRAQSLRRYLSRSPAAAKTQELARAKANLRNYPSGMTHDQIGAQVEALEEQLASRQRIEAAYQGAVAKIGATTARLEQLSAQLTEIVLLSDERAADAALPGARNDVANLVEELDSVRLALDEVTAEPALPGSDRVPPARQAEAQTE